MPADDTSQGVSNCYVFKSRLQEFAQKVGLPTPVYETVKEGPSHEPTFQSTVIVNGVRYDSLPGFFNRKAAEQSAAEVALMELSRSEDKGGCISQPVNETGLCKNLLQEYAQKMNYALPLYDCRKDDTPGRAPKFTCTIRVGGVKYIGAAANTKKEAEIKAARTALLAIQANASSSNCDGYSAYTVVPLKKKVADLTVDSQETPAVIKPKKRRFKRKSRKKRRAGDGGNHFQSQNTGSLELHMDDQDTQGIGGVYSDCEQVTNFDIYPREVSKGSQFEECFKENMENALVPYNMDFIPLSTSLDGGDGFSTLVNEVNETPGVG